MKKILTLLLFMIIRTVAFSQETNADHWKYSVDYLSNNEATLNFHLKLDKDWHVYSQNTPDGGPLPMVYTFEPNSCFERLGFCVEPAPKVEYDSSFEIKVFIFENEVTFQQRVKLNGGDCKIKGKIEYQICKQACISKETAFEIDVKKKKKK